MDQTEEDIKKRWKEYTELYKRDLNDPDNHNAVITCLESHIFDSFDIQSRKSSGPQEAAP